MGNIRFQTMDARILLSQAPRGKFPNSLRPFDNLSASECSLTKLGAYFEVCVWGHPSGPSLGIYDRRESVLKAVRRWQRASKESEATAAIERLKKAIEGPARVSLVWDNIQLSSPEKTLLPSALLAISEFDLGKAAIEVEPNNPFGLWTSRSPKPYEGRNLLFVVSLTDANHTVLVKENERRITISDQISVVE